MPDFFVEEVRLEAAAARVLLPELFFEAPLADERAEVFEPPRADERAADFFEADERDDDLPADLLADFAAVFLAPVFLAAVFVPPFLADDLEPLFAAVFLAADFAPVFLAAVFVPPFLADDFAAVLAPDFLAAVFFAPDFAVDFFPPEERRELLFFAGVEVDPLVPPAPPVLISLGFDLSSVGIDASFKGLRVHRHACKRQRRYIKRVPTNGKCPK